MSYTLTTSGSAIFKAGDGASTASKTSGSLIMDFVDKAESQFCMLTKYDWITNYSSVPANYKPAISDAVSDLAGIKLITYDMDGYISANAQTLLDALKNNSDRIIEFLKDEKGKDFVGV
jgi:hypothetical protein